MVSEQTEWSEDRAEAHRKAKMLREKAPDCPRKTEKQFPRATMDLNPFSPLFPTQHCRTAAPALGHL